MCLFHTLASAVSMVNCVWCVCVCICRIFCARLKVLVLYCVLPTDVIFGCTLPSVLPAVFLSLVTFVIRTPEPCKIHIPEPYTLCDMHSKLMQFGYAHYLVQFTICVHFECRPSLMPLYRA